MIDNRSGITHESKRHFALLWNNECFWQSRIQRMSNHATNLASCEVKCIEYVMHVYIDKQTCR